MEFVRKKFQNETIHLDNNSYSECEFKNCVLAYGGTGTVSLTSNSIENCKFRFDGAAASALKFMRDLYHGGGKDVIEATFRSIRDRTPNPLIH